MEREVERKVERRDRRDRTDGKTPDGTEGALAPRLDVHGHDLAFEPGRLLGGQADRGQAALDLGFREPARLPRFSDDRFDEFGAAVFDPVAKLPQDFGATVRRQRARLFESRRRRGDRALDLGGAGFRHPADPLRGPRRPHLDPVPRRDFLPGDAQRQVGRHELLRKTDPFADHGRERDQVARLLLRLVVRDEECFRAGRERRPERIEP